MSQSTRSKVFWTVWMSGGGMATGGIVYVLTGSVGWGIVGLLASGVVLNAIGQMVTKPIKAIRESQHRRDGPSGGSAPATRTA